MSPNEAQEAFLREGNVAVLATVDRRGRAHAAPIWYIYADGVFVMSTGRGSQKHRNIDANPEVTLVIDRRSLPYYYLTARGRAEIVRCSRSGVANGSLVPWRNSIGASMCLRCASRMRSGWPGGCRG